MSTQTTTQAEKTEFIIVGQCQGTGYTLWDIAPAPTDPARRAAVLEELSMDAMDAFGSVNTEYGATPREALNRFLAGMRDQSGLDDYDLTADSQTENLGPEEPMPAVAGDVLLAALAAVGINADIYGDCGGNRVVIDPPCGGEIWIADRDTLTTGRPTDRHAGWAANLYVTGRDRALYDSENRDLAADTEGVVAAVAAYVTAELHHSTLALAPHTLAELVGLVHPHLPEAVFLTIDAHDATLRAVLDSDRRTIWYAPASPTGLPEKVIDHVEKLAALLLRPDTDRARIDGHDDTCEIALPRP